MEQNENDRQSHLLHSLLRRLSYPEPEPFKLFFRIRLEDMFPPPGERPILDRAEQVYFHAALCQGDEVLTAALPSFLLPDGTQEELSPEDLAVLRSAGLPLFSDLLSPDGQVRQDPAPSGWRFPHVPVSHDLDGFLTAKKMVTFPASIPVPTQYGKQMGLCRSRWFMWDPEDEIFTSRGCGGMFCSAAGWVRLWEPPQERSQGDAPDWAPLPLDIRLERFKAGRTCNPGHCMSALRQLEEMPVAPVLSEYLTDKFIQDNLSDLRFLYGPGVTYGQAARKTDRLLRSDSEEDQELGRFSLLNLAFLFSFEYEMRRDGLSRTAVEKNIQINETKLESRSLSARLAWAGISENGGLYLPLVWDNLEDVLVGLGRLTGTDAPARAFFQELLPGLPPGWETLNSTDCQWDGTFDSMIARLREYPNSDRVQILRCLLTEPFCSLDQIRRLEGEQSGLLEEIREQNKSLKKKLERMRTDVSVH